MAKPSIRTTDAQGGPPPAGGNTRGGGRRADRRALALAVIVTSQLMLILDGTIVNIALPDIQRGLGFSAAELAWVVNAYALAFGGLLLLGGRAGDILGRRRTFTAGIVLFTVASLLGGFATTAGWLLAARAAQGVGAAIAGPGALALIASTFPAGPERNKALGLYAAVQAAGASLGLIAGGALTEWVSWRWVLFVNAPIGLVILLLAPRFIAETARRPGRFDLSGALAATIGMTSLVYGFIRAAEEGWRDGLTLGSFALAAVLLTLFVIVELRARQPIMPLRLLAGRTQAGAYLNMLLLPAAMLGMFFFLTQFVQAVLGFSPIEAGLAFLPLTVAIFAASQAVPRWLPRLGPRPFVVTGAALVAGGLLWLTRLSAESDYLAALLGPLLLLGVGVGFSLVPLSMIILSGVRGEDAGAASGLLQTMQQVGGSLGVAILVTVYGTAGREAAEDAGANATAPHLVAEAIGDVFGAAAVFAAAALLVAVVVIGADRSPQSERDIGEVRPTTDPADARATEQGVADAPEAAA